MPVGRERFAEELVVLASHDPKERALARAVHAEDANLRAGQKRQPDVLEDNVVGRMNLPETLHGVDELHDGYEVTPDGGRSKELYLQKAGSNTDTGNRIPVADSCELADSHWHPMPNVLISGGTG